MIIKRHILTQIHIGGRKYILLFQYHFVMEIVGGKYILLKMKFTLTHFDVYSLY